jgi:peptide/nickel transport system permease protein
VIATHQRQVAVSRPAWQSVRLRWLGRFPWLPVVLLLVVLVVPAVFAQVIAPYDPIKQSLPQRLKPPVFVDGGSWSHILGTDKQGRDVLSRLIFGARVSLSISLTAVLIGGTIGTLIGLVAGYAGGWLDHVLMRVVDLTLALPLVLMALVLASVFGPSFGTVVAVVVLLLWSSYARQVRAETLSLRHQDFVLRAKVTGASQFRVLLRHILPNLTNTVIVLATLQVGTVILLESTLSFLGVGVPPPYPSWGVMVADGRDLLTGAWWIAIMPGAAIVIVVLAMNVLGDWLRDHLDPKLRAV